MLKQLLKYEFKATKSLYFGLYLALALLSVVLGVSFRQENAWADNTNFGRLEVILMVLYLSVIFAIAVLCFVSTVQRFYKNLLGREGYLMHTLPVTETQLILSKLITSMVWVLCSGLVGIVCITVMVAVGVFDPETFGMADWESWKQLWGMLYGELGARFWLVTFWTILINLARLASLILCVYAACMIGHQFRNHSTIASILAFFLLQLIQGKLDAGGGIRVIVGSVAAMPMAYSASGNLWLVLLVTILIGAVYFVLTSWLMKNKLDLE